jgi:hypothetical protein
LIFKIYDMITFFLQGNLTNLKTMEFNNCIKKS